VEPAHLIHAYFLPRYYAIAVPITLGVILMGVIGELVLFSRVCVIVISVPPGVFVSIVTIQQQAKKAAKKSH